MKEMTPEEIRAFLTDPARTAHLATVRADGSPHTAPVWFILNPEPQEANPFGFEIFFTAWHTTVKARNITRDGRVALSIDDSRPPFAFVLIEGTAEVVDDLDHLRHWATRIAGRYMGADQAEAYGRRNAVPGELLMRVRPQKVVARDGIAD